MKTKVLVENNQVLDMFCKEKKIRKNGWNLEYLKEEVMVFR